MSMTIGDLSAQLLGRLEKPPVCDFIAAVTAVHTVIVNRLVQQKSDLVKDTLLIDFTAADDVESLSSTFDSVESLPYYNVAGGKSILYPLDRNADKTSSTLTTAGPPRWYETKGRKLTLYPPPSFNLQVKLPSYVRPALTTTSATALPFNGVFDQIYADGTMAVLAGGIAQVSNSEFVGMVTSQVDQIIRVQVMADEQALADTINSGQ